MAIAFVMPVFNEQDTVKTLISEIVEVFLDFDVRIYIVDDCSTDNSRGSIKEMIAEMPNVVFLIENKENKGHGISTIIGWKTAITSDCETVVCLDGDGEINLSDLKIGLIQHVAMNIDLSEGVRIDRLDPRYRVLITSILRYIVFLKTKLWIRDTNTPIRVYRREILLELSNHIEGDSRIPNVYIGILARQNNLKLSEFRISSKKRKSSLVGTTWNAKFAALPSKKFLKFILFAFLELRKFLSRP